MLKQKNLNFTILLKMIVPKCDHNSNYTGFAPKKISEKNLTERVKIVYHSFGINDDFVNEKLLKSHLFWHTSCLEVFYSIEKILQVIYRGILSFNNLKRFKLNSGLIAVLY